MAEKKATFAEVVSDVGDQYRSAVFVHDEESSAPPPMPSKERLSLSWMTYSPDGREVEIDRVECHWVVRTSDRVVAQQHRSSMRFRRRSGMAASARSRPRERVWRWSGSETRRVGSSELGRIERDA
jgi:hypothetical protein